MAIEIEKKFLLKTDQWKKITHKSVRIAQGYLCTDPIRTVRVRIKGDSGFITIKGQTDDGMSRLEFEYPIPLADAEALLQICPNILDKTRHFVLQDPFTWEIDEFHGLNAGLVVAEIELPSTDAHFFKPEWLGKEVSGQTRYYNSALSENPYKNW